jgi:uncharacterized repeat protein (TIGR03803 family)
MKRNDFLSITNRLAVIVTILVSAVSTFAAGAKYNVIYRFQGNADGATPSAPLIADQAGNLYGTTQDGGGSSNCSNGCGTVFRFKPPVKKGGAWQETILHSFNGTDGSSPFLAPLIFDHAGNLYGVAGNNIFELTPPKKRNGEWTETVLYTFTNGNDGGSPNGVIFDSAGNLYGSTQTGGLYGQQGAGTIFELTPIGGAWSETTLYSFKLVGDGNQPGVLVFDSKGNLYGTNKGDSVTCTPKFPFKCGTVFELKAPAQKGGSWEYTEIHAFQGFNDASYPDFSGVVFDPSGNLYGTTGGTSGTGDVSFEDSEGTVFELTPPVTKSGAWTEIFLHHFPRPGGIDGSYPKGDVVFDASGNAYGVTFYGAGNTKALCVGRGCGIVFELKVPATKGGAWKEIRLHEFNTAGDGEAPSSGLLLGSGGVLFGTTAFGGGSSACEDGCGTVFEIVP